MLARARRLRRPGLAVLLATLVAGSIGCGEATLTDTSAPETTAPDAQGHAPPDVAPTGAARLEDEGWSLVRGENPDRVLAWRPADLDAVPRNQSFALEVRVLRDGAPHTLEALDLKGWMPAHGHGLVQLPEVTEQAPGHYRVDGLLLHMRGLWELRFGLLEDGAFEILTVEVEL